MNRMLRFREVLSLILSSTLILSGCTKALIHDDVKYAPIGAHCSGSEEVDDSPLAVLPIPVVAFFVPHGSLHDIKADDYLKRCGETTKLINRNVEINRNWCIPAGLTRIISLGIWQWCPASVSWDAAVKT